MKNLIKLILGVSLIAGFAFSLNAQGVGIKADGTAPDNSAMLDVSSSTRGFLIPRMTMAQIGEIASPADGLMAYNTTDGKYYLYVASAGFWKEMDYGSGTITPVPFVCGLPISDDRDNKVYNTVLIGTQCWMAQNLNVGTRINGLEVQTNNNIIEKYCYNNDDANCATYGGLYQWDEMMQYATTEGVQGICPLGWHLPSDAEWTTLSTSLGGESIAGGMMKETGTTHWASPNTGATNSSGFTGLPGGYRRSEGMFLNHSYYGTFWSSTPINATNAWYRFLFYTNTIANRYDIDKGYAFSVRCVRD